MPNQQLVDYINQCLAQSQTKEQIKQSLLSAGWQEGDIEEGFGSLGSSANIVSNLSQAGTQQAKRFSTKLLIGIISGVVVLSAIGGGFYLWQKTESENKAENQETATQYKTIQQENQQMAVQEENILDAKPQQFSCGISTISDVDGNQYHTVKIGNQCWLKENLKVTKNSKGDNIARYCFNDPTACDTLNSIKARVKDDPKGNEVISSLITKYCSDNNVDFCNIDGGLYDWKTTMGQSSEESSRGICPVGWHVPAKSEWITLGTNVGLTDIFQQQDMQWRGTDNESTLNIGGSSGFDLALGGFCHGTSERGIKSADCKNKLGVSMLWTSSNYSPSLPFYVIGGQGLEITRGYYGPEDLFSVRCLKDN